MYLFLKILCLVLPLLFMEIDVVFGRILSEEVWDDIRLENGSNPWEGRVEVKVNNTWGTVCVDRWSLSDGHVVCNQLGYDSVEKVFMQGQFGKGAGPTLHDNLRCTGHEKNLDQCAGIHDTTLVNCHSKLDAGVSCVQPHVSSNKKSSCLETQFKCFNENKCIPRRWLCDDQIDCSGGADENKILCNKHCGEQKQSPTVHRIVGGSNSRLGTWPWMASLRIDFQSGVSSTNLCGGTLIDKYWVLTAAHCFDNYVPTASTLRVVVGKVHSSSHDVTEKVLRVRQVIKHSGYATGSYDNDIALIQLVHPVDTSHPYIKPACIQIPGEQPFDTSSNCFVTGFGKTAIDQGRSTTLKEAMVPIINNTVCSSWYQQRILDSTLCAGYKFGGIDACQGDSGGPLSCKRGDRWYVAGVVSWGEGCARMHHPGIYTSVSYYVTWITDVINRNTVSTLLDIIG